ncbi:putative trans-sialidase, Group V [Trypanosoma cruzi]|uniref:Trans-sialidase, putative n=1 Tax=Trypanosoma cruzi (strain CL Brener) TaxID=353153 RepID=Q4D7M7_TRYCC|nr:trans-sialidase, putative [Trypanosoma cruzi]EAN88532.1 trans-sialidase, putative [Trypanosoma cruzi]KAF8289782.1 putative trans-sialidase, Group V [Trypanosoma cruzi]|eukprot:XP_810383.1 trans-sialidase [Trypanosoma cruzi strain CL Brener]
MLSRVAAVKAPRTHNRRRVTGSSGKMREGRESEPQRPNMSRHVFTSAVLLLLVVMMMCCGTGAVTSDEEHSTIPNFEWTGITNDKEVVESLGVPGLLKVGNDVFAVAEAQCKKDGNSGFSGIASQLLTMGKGNEPKEVLKDAKKDTQVLEEGTSPEEERRVDVSRPTAVVEGGKIYMLVGKHSHGDVAECKATSEKTKSGILLVKGNVGGDEAEKKIRWNDTDGLPCTIGEEHKSLSQLILGGGSGVKLKDGTFFFPVEATKKKEKKEEKDVKTVSLIIYSLKDTKSWKLSKGMSADGCGDPSVVEWKEKLMMMTACDDGRRRVYEIGDKGESWTEALGTLSRVWGNKQKRHEKGVTSGLITATIDGVDSDKRNVMLVTLPVYSEKDGKKKGKLHLWLTDNAHIVDIGPVSGDDDVAASSLLYRSAEGETKEELIALYEKKKEGGEDTASLGMVSALLTAQLQRVKEVLTTWKEADERVSKLCPTSSATEDTSSGTACGAVKITDGLVGFLSGKFSDGTWRDEYLGVNATVKENDVGGKKATLHEGGVTFQGAWAQWPVGKQGENQLYHFANCNFTLVATVSIHKVPKGDNPLMGVKMNDNGKTVLLGLSYNNKETKWILLCGDKRSEELSSPWEPGKKHQLAIVLQNGSQGSAYVDGQPVGGDEQCALETADSKVISHFFIGGDERSAGGAGSEEEVSVTVTNVLLYNRPLISAEIDALNPNKLPIPPPVGGSAQGTLLQSPSDGQPLSDLKLLNEDEGVGGGSASTSAVSTVTTSSGKEQSANQLSSGIFSGGKKNVDGGSSSNDDQTVGAEAGDTVPGDGPPQTPAGTPATADANTPTATGKKQVDPADTTEVSVSSGGYGETAGGTDAQKEEVHPQDGDVNATALSSSLGNLSQVNNSDAGTMRESGLLPSLLLLLGLWGFAAL